MIASCMPHQRPDAAPAVTAELVHLAPLRIRRAARELNDDCPGWHAWYSVQGNQWIAHRCGNWSATDASFDAGDDPARRRLFAVAAADPELLRLVINWQALLDLDADHGEWELSCTDDGFWWACWAGGNDGRTRPVFCATSPVKLVWSVRAYVASVRERDERCPAWW